jgi:hypothetical protein
MKHEEGDAVPAGGSPETRAEIVLVQVDFNRQFFDKFHEVFEKDEGWACEFTDACREKRIGPDGAYLEIRRREETRKKKGLPPRVTLLENWDMGDERRYDEDQAAHRKHAAKKRRKKGRKQKAFESPKPAPTKAGATPTQGEVSNQLRNASRV